jgi:lysosomal acid phosphatase
MSAYSNLAGFFPPGNSSEKWNPDLDWQPIPVHTVSQNVDNVRMFVIKLQFMFMLTWQN